MIATKLLDKKIKINNKCDRIFETKDKNIIQRAYGDEKNLKNISSLTNHKENSDVKEKYTLKMNFVTFK